MPQEQFFVEVILKARRRKTGTQKIGTFPVSKFDIRSNAWEYLVHWAGWPDSDDSYEPVKNLADCTRLLQRFWEAAGKDGFLTNVVDFEIDAPEDWIRQEKAYFWSRHTPNEVRAQNDDPRQKHSTSKHGSSKPSTPSTSKTRGAVKTSPRTPSSPPKKVVSFALVADVIGIPKLTDVENTAQRYFTGTKQTYDSEDDEQMDVESHEETPTKMIKLRLLGPRPPTQAPPLDLQHNDEFDAAPTPEPTVSAHESTAEAPPATSNSGPPSPPPSPPTRRSGGIKFVENLGMTNPVMSTKSRLTKKPMAQGIPRASPVPAPPPKDAPTSASAPEGDAMDVDPTPMLFPDNIVDDRVGDADGLGPMLASMEPFNEDVGVGGSGFYDASEDRYAGLPKNGDPYGDSAYLNAGFDVDMPDTAASEFYVDQFLTTVPMPKDVNTDDYRPNKPIHDEPVSFGKWSWTGRVTMTVGETAQTLCERAMVTDATEAASPRLAAFIVSCKPLEFTSLFDIGDIRAFLPAFQPHQYARLFAEGPDGENLAVFSEFMARKQRAVLFPALWDEKLVGCLLFVSSSSKYLLKELEVPKELYADTPCLIAILFVGNSDVPAIQEHYRHLLPPMQRTVERAVLSHEQWRRSIREEKGYHLALHIIQLPVDVREFLYNHPSTVWCKIPDDGDADGREDQETKLLRRILRKSKVGSVAPEDLPAETHTVFVHAGALRNIHNLPHLMQRRLRPDVRFCLYGTHETVHLSRWGFREIYLLGGVVTFTPEALVDDAWAVLRTIRDINAHPLWACYLLPQVLGLAHKLSQTREDETAEYRDSLPYTLDQLCKAIHKGQVSLMHTPVNDSDEQISRWVVDRVLLRPQTTQAVLDCSIKAFEEAYASEPPASWGTLAKNDVLADMRRMQVQPIMVDQYRRFVVLDSSSNLSRYKPVDGVEWDGVGQFSFRDNFKWEPRC